jgi:hypothetical protein
MKKKKGGEMALKTCSRCRRPYPLDAFCKDKQKSDGLRSSCRECDSKNRNVSPESRLKKRDYDSQRKDKAQKDRNLARYGLSSLDYKNLLDSQGGACAICRMLPRTIQHPKNLSVDHCHIFGIVRGLLCINCNIGLGLLDDSIEILTKAKVYLQTWEEKGYLEVLTKEEQKYVPTYPKKNPKAYTKLVTYQSFRCAICHGPPVGNCSNLSVDHCHKTGMVRGALCHTCNTGLGAFKESVDLLNVAIRYKVSFEDEIPNRMTPDDIKERLRLLSRVTQYLEAFETRKNEGK